MEFAFYAKSIYWINVNEYMYRMNINMMYEYYYKKYRLIIDQVVSRPK